MQLSVIPTSCWQGRPDASGKIFHKDSAPHAAIFALTANQLSSVNFCGGGRCFWLQHFWLSSGFKGWQIIEWEVIPMMFAKGSRDRAFSVECQAFQVVFDR